MKTVYLDCTSGITGESLLGALIDTGINPGEIITEIKALIDGDYQLIVKKHHIFNRSTTEVSLHLSENHPVTCMEAFAGIIPAHKQNEAIGRGLKNIFERFYRARTKHSTVNGYNLDLKDLIIAAGALAAMYRLHPGKIMAAPLPMKIVHCCSSQENDQLNLEIASGITIKPENGMNIVHTPLGIALLAALAEEYGSLPEIKLEQVGYGSSKNGHQPETIVRVIAGRVLSPGDANSKYERVIIIQTSIDDMNPEFYPYLTEKVLAAGALDVYLTPVMMKKGRPAGQLTAICRHENVESVTNLIFKESTTLGVRLREEKRITAGRRFETANTVYGSIRVKVGYLQEQNAPIQIAPEFDDCQKRARESGVPVKEVYAAAYQEILKKYTSP